MFRIIYVNLNRSCRFFSIISNAEGNLSSSARLLTSEKNFIANEEITNFYDKFDGTKFDEIKSSEITKIVNDARDPSNFAEDLFVLYDLNTINMAIKMNAKMMSLFFSNRKYLHNIPFSHSSNDVQISRSGNIKELSFQRNQENIIAIFKRPSSDMSKKVPLTLILDRITEPNNLSAIMSIAVDFNVRKILLTKGCVDLYNEKVVNDAMQTIMHTPIYSRLKWDNIEHSLEPGCKVFYAETYNNKGDLSSSLPYYSPTLINFERDTSYGLIIGGETAGVSDLARSLSVATGGCRLVIPLVPSINSLNSSVAAAILLSEFRRLFIADK